MLKKIIDHIHKKGIRTWQIREVKKTSYQSFLALSDLECRRTVDTLKYRISIYEERAQEKKVLGFSSFTLSAGQENLLDTMLDQSLESARLTANEPFGLPGATKNPLPSVPLLDPSLSFSAIGDLEERIRFAVSKEENIRLSAAEFFLDRLRTRLLNSNGLDIESEESFVHSEFVLLAQDGAGGEKEFISRLTRRYLADFQLKNEVHQAAKKAREAVRAVLPQTGTFPVVFSEEPLDHLFNPLIARTSARLKYNRMLPVEKGRSVLEGAATGDPITIWSDPLRPGAVGSYQFDSYGTPAQKICLIEKNSVKTLLADHRYGEYLHVPVTGDLGNTVVEPGSVSFHDALDPDFSKSKTLYHITAFSAFEPNAITGAFSAEIRTGYEISAQGIKPIKGGSVAGVLQKDLASARLARETDIRERVVVPRGVLFSKLSLAGS